jgi:hypothetical protein
MKTKLNKLFEKYERKFGAARSQRVTQPANHTGKRKQPALLLTLLLLNLHAT